MPERKRFFSIDIFPKPIMWPFVSHPEKHTKITVTCVYPLLIINVSQSSKKINNNKLKLCNWVYSGVFLIWPPPHVLMFSAKRDLMTLLKAVLTNKLNQKIFDDCVESNVNKQTERRSSVIFLFQTICFATTICYTNSHLFCNNKACHCKL